MRDARLDPDLLGTFLEVLDAGRISSAARTLHLSQPAVTAQVRKLEAALGRALFVRSVRGVSPTGAGLRLATYALQIRKLLDEASAELRPADDRIGPLTIAASTTIAAHVLPPLLAQFRTANPQVPIRLQVANTEGVVEAVRNGRVPLGLVEGHPRAPGVRLEAFLDDEIVPIVARDSRFAIRRVSDLETIPILWREAGSGTRAVVERALTRSRGHRVGIRDLDLELDGTEAVIGAAAADLGVAFVSRWSVRPHLAAGLVRIIPGLDLLVRRTFRWALPAGALAGPARAFYDFARQRPPA